MPFFSFYGGKWRAALTYPAPVHDVIVEPFAGSAGYAVRYADRKVFLVERDFQIAAVWRFLIGATRDDILSLPLLQVDQRVDEFRLAVGPATLIGFWVNKGSAVPKVSQSAWMRSGIRPKSFWGAEIRARIAEQVSRIKHWEIVCGDYSDAPDVEATWFVDPPYQVKGSRYRYRKIDYAALASWVRSRRGQKIACENVGATWLPFRPHVLAKANESKHGGKRSAEAIYVC